MKKKNNTSGIGATGDTRPVPQPPPTQQQSLPKQAEEYLRESGNIEDLPDPEQDKEADPPIRKTQAKK